MSVAQSKTHVSRFAEILRLDPWASYLAEAERVYRQFQSRMTMRHFDYVHPVSLQAATPRRLRKPYPVRVSYSAWGRDDLPLLICCGGVANVAMRFCPLAFELQDAYRVICMDWVGRGLSGWMADEADYSLATYAEQLRQMIDHLGGGPVTVLGSSMGGSAAIELIAREPARVSRLILNDIGPHIPAGRRRRRAETLSRHYVFRNQAELLRKIGASMRNDGPVDHASLVHLSYHQTRWSDEEGGRVYRHDVRAMQAYRQEARHSLQQWAQWRQVQCPMLLIRAMDSDALLDSTVTRMQRGKAMAVMHLPNTGHAPLLADGQQIGFIRRWLLDTAPHS